MAQWIARMTSDHKVGGSSPSGVALFSLFEVNVGEVFKRRPNNRIYTQYKDGNFLLLRFVCHRGAFREDMDAKCVLCEKEDNGIEHVINKCGKNYKKKEEN